NPRAPKYPTGDGRVALPIFSSVQFDRPLGLRASPGTYAVIRLRLSLRRVDMKRALFKDAISRRLRACRRQFWPFVANTSALSTSYPLAHTRSTPDQEQDLER